MATTNIDIIKSWFLTGLKPTQIQFHAWMDSYWHKSEKIPISTIDDIENILNAKADKAVVDALKSKEPIPANAADQVDGVFTIMWDADKVVKYGKYGRFEVEMNGNYEQVVKKIIKDGDGNPTAYTFQLDGIDSLIHII